MAVSGAGASLLTIGREEQLGLETCGESTSYLTKQLLTYIGNKRALLTPIRSAIETVRERTGQDKLRIFDAFSGSGAASRMFKQYASELIVNDIEDYARVTSECYLSNRCDVDLERLADVADALNRAVASGDAPEGFIRRQYAPADPENIRPEDRVFYTPENAARLDAYRQLLDREPAEVRSLLMGPLLSAASVHANTAGVFKGFYKDRDTGVGKFGGSGADALERIMAPILLRAPVLSNYECDFTVYQQDTNSLVQELDALDVAYLDPPYNQHPYGSNYFMLNLLVDYREPVEVSRVSGIPSDWRRSDYNVRSRSLARLSELVRGLDARFVIVSFNDEGFIAPPELRELLSEVGTVSEHQESYNAYRGSRNLRERSTHVTEHVYLVEKD